jgi:hypothetical protein
MAMSVLAFSFCKIVLRIRFGNECIGIPLGKI